MARNAKETDLDLGTLKGRLAFAIKAIGPSKVEKLTSLSRAQVSRIANLHASTTLESAAEIAIATGFELKWIALGEGPQRIDDELWEHTNKFKRVPQLDDSQEIGFSFNPEIFDKHQATQKNCLTWVITSPLNLKSIETGHTVLIDTSRKLESGIIVIKANNKTLVGELSINIDGSAKFITDVEKPNTDQHLTKEQLESLEIIGHVIWFGA